MVRYRLAAAEPLRPLLGALGGHLRSSRTLPDYHRLCRALDQPAALPLPLTADSRWFAGYFDGRGTLELLETAAGPQPRLELVDRYLADLEPLRALFGGSLAHDPTSGGLYRWGLEGWGELEGLRRWRADLRPQPFRSRRAQRFFLLPEAQRLLALGAAAPEADPLLAKAWATFRNRWEEALRGPLTPEGVTASAESAPDPENHWPLSTDPFWQWLGGLVDGDGHLYLDKGRYPALVLAAATAEVAALERVQSTLGCGSVGRDTRSESYTYKLYGEEWLRPLLERLRNHLRGAVRRPQLELLCGALGMACPEASPLTADSHWFAGFFAADGHFSLAIDPKGFAIPNLRVTAKHAADLEHFRVVFGGAVYPAKTQREGHEYCWHIWAIGARPDLERALEYFRSHPCHCPPKELRLGLLPELYALRDQRAHRAPTDSELGQRWMELLERWRSVAGPSRPRRQRLAAYPSATVQPAGGRRERPLLALWIPPKIVALAADHRRSAGVSKAPRSGSFPGGKPMI
jgi:hypothetical protein